MLCGRPHWGAWRKMKKVICILFSFVILLTSVFADKSRFYEAGKVINTMYVNSKEGLRVRDKPSLKANRICGLNHRMPIKIISIGKEETIDNITAPWVEILVPRYQWKNKEVPEYGWVFGGYLVKDQPEFSTENWKYSDLKRFLTSKSWIILVLYDSYARLKFYENDYAEFNCGDRKWSFNYKALSGNEIRISNISDPHLEAGYSHWPSSRRDIYDGIYELKINELFVTCGECALNLTYMNHISKELFHEKELYETNDYDWINDGFGDFRKEFKNYFEFYLYHEKLYGEIKEDYVNNFIISGLYPDIPEYQQKYDDYWNPIMEGHQKEADAIK